MPRTDRASCVVNASPLDVFSALVDRRALETWLPPEGMTASFERFDPTPGGSYRLVLTYGDPTPAGGKSTADSDVVEARYVEIVPGERVVQAVDFVSDDPAFAGTMTMTWAMRAVDGGTRVEVTAEHVPDGISAEDHAAGLRSSLEHLARYVESRPGHRHRDQRFDGAAQAAEWDTRYSERDGAMWSGRPNGRLVAELADVAPGRALDVGCGEGADAIWLTRAGWTVTAMDVSAVALTRARDAADRAGVTVEWVLGDALGTPPPPRSFDLVSMQYPALPKAAGDDAVRALLETLRPGGLLLAVYHDLDHDHCEHMRSRGVDPDDYVGIDDLARLLGDDCTVERCEVASRIDPPPGTPHIADVVLRARRR